MDGKLRHRPKMFMGVQDLKRPFSIQIVATTEKSEFVL
jgi:hypothetical protein